MNILTFDIEDWFHILDNSSTKTEKEWNNYPTRIREGVDRILELLEKQEVKATFFCLGWVARKYPDVIRKIDEAGYEIASHSDLHQLVYEQDTRQFKSDLETSVKSLEDVIGKKIRAYRAPGFSITEGEKWAFDALLELGIEMDCSVFPSSRSHGGFASFTSSTPCYIERNGALLKEFPISPASLFGKKLIFSGGGYFRLLPYQVIKRLSRQSDYTMTYFHPRDFDPQQPVLEDLSMARRFKSYYGLAGALPKLYKWTDQQEFTDLAGADEQINWDKVAIIKL
jgi:peptidoglycan-N-acetylglucosamine deacetylase